VVWLMEKHRFERCGVGGVQELVAHGGEARLMEGPGTEPIAVSALLFWGSMLNAKNHGRTMLVA